MENQEEMMREEVQEEIVQDDAISREQLGAILFHFNGKNQEGLPKVSIAYQTFAMDEPEDSLDRETIYTCEKASIELGEDFTYPNFFTLDIIFHGADEPELKLLWGRLQKFKHNIAAQPERDWIFHLNIIENACVTNQTSHNDFINELNVFNPVLSFLTREVPEYLCNDMPSKGQSQQANAYSFYGGNVIRMLVPTPFVLFNMNDDSIDTNEIKGDVIRELEEIRYQNASDANTGESW